MRVVVVVFVLGAVVARADVAPLSTDRVALLDGHLSLRVVVGSEVESLAAQLDWGDTRLTVVARDLGTIELAGLRDRIVHEVEIDGQDIASIDRLLVAQPDLELAASIHAPHLVNGRALVYAAFLVDGARRGYELAFYVSEDASEAWGKLAATIARTAIVVPPERSPSPPQPTVLAPPTPTGSCASISDLHVEPYPAGANVLPTIDGLLFGRAVTWSEWQDGLGYHAEAASDDAHAYCSGTTDDALERARVRMAK
jgi:hypothetical protein